MSPNGCYVRVGNSTHPMTVDMIDDLYSGRIRNSLYKIQSPTQNLTFAQLKIYYEEKGFELNKSFAKNLELLTDHGKYNYNAYLFLDRIMITSTGSLPQALSKQEFLSGISAPRNKEIMRIFKDIQLVEHLGPGVTRILEKYDESVFDIIPNFGGHWR